jgi:hypothetical protein
LIELADIGARCKGALAGSRQDDRAHAGVGIELGKQSAEFGDHPPVECVENLRAIERYDADRAGALDG